MKKATVKIDNNDDHPKMIWIEPWAEMYSIGINSTMIINIIDSGEVDPELEIKLDNGLISITFWPGSTIEIEGAVREVGM